MITKTYLTAGKNFLSRGLRWLMRWPIALSCSLVFFSAVEARETSLDTTTSQMKISTMTRQTMPDNCDSPYKDVSGFNVFFDSTIFVMASEKGPQDKGIGDLFAVSELQKKMQELFPNIGEESPIDRLVIAQLCKYREIFKDKTKLSDAAINVPSDDPILHKHLAQIAPQLFIDARGLMVSALAAHARTEARRAQINIAVDRVERAREIGRNKVEGLFKSFQ